MTGKHIVCFSGGEGSALVAIEVKRRYGSADLILLNHDICPRVEDSDVKRFKAQVAEYCGVPVTFANLDDWEHKDQFDVCVEAGAFKVGNGTALCTNRLKTAPFHEWLRETQPDASCCIYYGFGPEEQARIKRRRGIMAIQGYTTDYPLCWKRTILSTSEVGIVPPLGYSVFKHANCVGCLKAGMQHWYIVYCIRPDIWTKALWAEEQIGYSIIKGHSLLSLEPKFAAMEAAGIETTEKVPAATFWASVRRHFKKLEEELNRQTELGGPGHCSQAGVPCECGF